MLAIPGYCKKYFGFTGLLTFLHSSSFSICLRVVFIDSELERDFGEHENFKWSFELSANISRIN